MSIETFRIQLDIPDNTSKYSKYQCDRCGFSSDLSHQSHKRYYRQKGKLDDNENDLLTNLVTGFAKSITNALRPLVDSAVKAAVIATGGKWID